MATGSTPYDDVFRTILNDCRNLIHPLLNEIFGEMYSGQEAIDFGSNEHFLRQQNGESDKRITDSSFTVTGIFPIRYHLECQSTSDSTMDRRMFEYDSQIALEDSAQINHILTLPFPKSAVLFLRKTSTAPQYLRIQLKILHPNKTVTLEIPIIYIIDYTVKELFQKNLLILLPFHLFCYEHSFSEMEKNEEQRKHLKNTYTGIRLQLEKMTQQHIITEYTCQTILDLSRKVAEHLCAKYDTIKKEVIDSMGGKILEYEAKTILNEGKITMCLKLIRNGLLSITDAARQIPMEESELRKLLQKSEQE